MRMTDSSGVDFGSDLDISGDLDAIPPNRIVDESSSLERVPPRLTSTSIGRLQTRSAASRKTPYFNALIYGDSGVGKTLLVATAALVPEMCPILFLDFEEGYAVLEHLDNDALQNIEMLPGEDAPPLKWTDVQNIYDFLYRGKHPFKTVVMDTSSEAQAANIGYLLGYEGKVDIDAKLPKFEEWNETTSQMRRMFRGFRDLRMNTIFTAHTYDEPHPSSTKENPRVWVRPDFVGKKLRQEAPAFFNMVFYMYAKRVGKENLRYVMADRDETYTAKCRIPGVPKVIDAPTIEGMYDAMIRNPQPSRLDLSGATVSIAGTPQGTSAGGSSGRMMKKKA